MDFGQVRWVEWYYLTFVFVLGISALFFMFWSYRNRFLDDLECTKYNVFTLDPNPDNPNEPEAPAYCRLRYLEDRTLWGHINSNNGWVWITAALIGFWLLVVGGAFVASLFVPAMRQMVWP